MDRIVGEEALEQIALGAPVLGTGGGGDPYIGELIARQAIRSWGNVRMIQLEDVPANALVIASAMMGAPTVAIEKVPSGDEAVGAFRALEDLLGQKAFATYSIEAGGLNSTIPIATAARLQIPLIDADCMGRAFPELHMVSPSLHDMPATPMAIADEKGNLVLLKQTSGNGAAERLARRVTVSMGASTAIALYPMTGRAARRALIGGSISLARSIGWRLMESWRRREDPLEAVLRETAGLLLFQGRIADVNRRTDRGFARGTATIAGTPPYEGRTLEIRFQNENLIATMDGQTLASVPDLITVLDAESAAPITTERLRFGLRVSIVGIPCDPMWRTPKGLSVVGPRAFGYPDEYRPLGPTARR